MEKQVGWGKHANLRNTAETACVCNLCQRHSKRPTPNHSANHSHSSLGHSLARLLPAFLLFPGRCPSHNVHWPPNEPTSGQRYSSSLASPQCIADMSAQWVCFMQ